MKKLLGLILGAASILSLAACGNKKTTNTGSTGDDTKAGGKVTLKVLNWGDYINDELVEKFEKANNCNVKIYNSPTNEEIMDNNEVKIRINNSFVNANKQFLIDLKNKWNQLNNYTFDSVIGSRVCDLIDSTPVVTSDKNLMIMFEYNSLSDKINSDLSAYEDILNSKLGIKQKIVAVNSEDWNKLKNEYLNNLKNNIKYEYIDLDSFDNNNIKNSKTILSKKCDAEKKAKNLFGELLEK